MRSRGMGCAGCGGGCKGLGTSQYEADPDYVADGSYYDPNAQSVIYIQQPSSSPDYSLLSSIANALAAGATRTITNATSQPPVYVTNPQTGQSILYDPNSGRIASGTTALPNLGAGGGGTVALIAAAVAAIVILGKR
jgi:hypothetical protein